MLCEINLYSLLMSVSDLLINCYVTTGAICSQSLLDMTSSADSSLNVGLGELY